MPGAMHRMGVYLGLVEDDEFADGEGWDEPRETHTDRAPARRESYADARYSRATKHDPRRSARRSRRSPGSDVNGYATTTPTLRRPLRRSPGRAGYQITALHPRTYNEARTIGEAFRANTPVIMNLSEMDDADAKRLVDFAAGLTFGLHGRIERVTAKVFLLSPHNVTVTAQDKAKIENGFFNQS